MPDEDMIHEMELDEQRGFYEMQIARLRSRVERLEKALRKVSDRGPAFDPVPRFLEYLEGETNADEAFYRGMDKAAYHSAEIARTALQEKGE